MTTKHWLGTAAAVVAITTTISASAIAQGQPEMRREGGERGAPASAAPRETGRPMAGSESRPQAREQAETRESKPAAAQKNAEQPARGERDQSAQHEQREGRDTREGAKDATDAKQKQGAADERKGESRNENRAADTNKADTTKADANKADTNKADAGKAAQQPAQRQDREADRHDRNPAGATQQSESERKSRGSDQATDKQGAERSNQAAQPARPNNSTAQQGTPSDARQRDAAGQGQNQNQADRGRAGTTVSMNDQRRTQVFDRLHHDREFNEARTDIDIHINVGERLPERVRPRRLPDDIVTIVPEYRGYDYTVVHDDIAIIDPRSREIVDVIPQGGVTADRGYGGDRTRIVLSDDQRQIFRRAATSGGTVGSTVSSSSGSTGPTCLSLQRVPDEIARSNPELASYQYLAIGDQVVLIDPQNQKVVQVIDPQQQQQ